MDIGSTLWGSGLRKTVTSVSSLVAAVAGAVVAVPPAWSALGLPEIATRVFVHEQVEPVKTVLAQVTQSVNELLLAQLQAQLYQAQLDEQRAPSPTVEQRISDLKAQIAQTQQRLNSGSR